MTDALLYLRKSRDPHNLASIQDQERLGRELIEAERWILLDVLDDAGRSASRFATRGRPGWDELLSMIAAGRVGVVVLWESSRGDRKLTEWSAFLDECRSRNVLLHVVSHHRTYDLSIPRDWRTLAEDGVDNAYESERISIRVRRGQAGAALRGEPYGPVPYGYKAVYSMRSGKREGWEIVPEHAEIVRHLVLWIGSNRPVLALCQDLDERGVPSPAGGAWAHSTIRQMARLPTYAGLRKLPDGTLVDGKWPAIVTRQQWADACAALDGRRSMARPGAQKHLMSYLARCAECMGPMLVYSRHERMYYRCRKGHFSVYYEWLDESVSEVIIARFSRDDAKDVFRRDDSRTEALDGELVILRQRRSEFRRQAAIGKIEPDALAEIEAELVPEIGRRQRELDALTIDPALAGIVAAEDVRTYWKSRTVQGKRAIIASVTEIVVKHPKRVGRSMVLPDDPGELLTFTWRPRRPGTVDHPGPR